MTLAAKLLVLAPGTSLLLQLSTYLFTLARYDQDYDVRDRARFLGTLLRGVRLDKTGGTLDQNGEAEDEDEDGELGGVVLRREQVRVILMGKRAVVHDVKIGQGEYEVGSMSRAVGKRLAGYEELPEWTDDPTDSSLRDSEVSPLLRIHCERLLISARSRSNPDPSYRPRPLPRHRPHRRRSPSTSARPRLPSPGQLPGRHLMTDHPPGLFRPTSRTSSRTSTRSSTARARRQRIRARSEWL